MFKTKNFTIAEVERAFRSSMILSESRFPLFGIML
jgi:hypothetical protein